jgi:hypothetical protein
MEWNTGNYEYRVAGGLGLGLDSLYSSCLRSSMLS